MLFAKLDITHYALHVSHYTMHNVQCWMQRMDWQLSIVQCASDIANCIWHYTLKITYNCTMHSEHNAVCNRCTLQISNSTFDILHSEHSARYNEWISLCLLPIAYCTLPNAHYCLLHIVSTVLDATDGLPIVADTTHSPPGLSLCLFVNIHCDEKIAALDYVLLSTKLSTFLPIWW